MGSYETIDRLCKITNELLDIVKKQAEVIEQADVPKELALSLENDTSAVVDELDVIEYELRRYI